MLHRIKLAAQLQSRHRARWAHSDATIFAPATGKGKSAIAILRISGPEVLQVWHQMTRSPFTKFSHPSKELIKNEPVARKAMLRKIIHPTSKEVLDEGIVIYFPANSALTAQPTLEIHTHGSPALIFLLLRLLPSLSPGFRIAEAGEFTRLAFEANKLDLTEVEGIRDLVESETEQQRKLATRQAGGEMRRKYEEMRASVIDSMSLVEALIDFGEDEGISEEVFDLAKSKAEILHRLIARYLNDERRGEIIRAGIRLTILGAPNAGKSSLLNWLAQREAAIVDSTAGTTRDVIELSLDFHGFPIIVADTAGLRATLNVVEAIGVQRAIHKASGSDLKLCILSPHDIFTTLGQEEFSTRIDSLTLSQIDKDTIIILNKIDSFAITPTHTTAIEKLLESKGINWIHFEGEQFCKVSVQSGDGLGELVNRMKLILERRFGLEGIDADVSIITSARHRHHLIECNKFLEAFLKLGPDEIVFAAEELRGAMLSIGRITGSVDTEEVLGEIFRGFCVGK